MQLKIYVMPVIELSIKNVLVGTFTEDASIWFATPNPSRANWPQKTRRAFWNLLPNSLVSFGKLFFWKKGVLLCISIQFHPSN